MNNDWIIPDWQVPANVRAVSTTRNGGHSLAPWNSLNLGVNCGDDPEAVLKNRRVLREHLPAEPLWLQQEHGVRVVNIDTDDVCDRSFESVPVADARLSTRPGQVCAIQTADCLPVLLCNRSGTKVAAAHAGWRGLAAGVVENTVQAFCEPCGQLKAWLGPAIGPSAYQVGEDVKMAFMQRHENAATFFTPTGDRYLLDLYAMARHCLFKAGVVDVSGGEYCTYSEPDRFFSYRRDGSTGRMASLIWLQT